VRHLFFEHMGEARHNILVKSAQMQRMNNHFYGKQMFDTINLLHFSEESLSNNPFTYLKR